MSNSCTLNMWHLATCYLSDRRLSVSEKSFKQLMGTLRARDLMKLLDYPVDPLTQSIEEYRTISQLLAFFSKNADYSDDAVCTASAERRFRQAELMCRITNKRLRFYRAYPERDKYGTIVENMRIELRKLLGSPVRYLDGIPSSIRLTSGSTEDSKRRDSLPYLKIRGITSCTPGSIPFVMAFANFHGLKAKVRTVEANRIVLVPKNAKTHRTIAAEPQGNLPFQLSLDSYLKSRLLYWGIDLSSQLRNQLLAREGSVKGNYATIDLSMASDTLSLEVVRFLLPPQWVEIFTRLRSSFYKGSFGYGEYQKFSSMGNGYTFTLETAVFTAAIRALGITDYAVYGDDIVVPTDSSSEVIGLLRYLGFKTNVEKTFVQGPFRESCGADYYNGVAVRPFYVRRFNKLSNTDLAHVLNGLFRVGEYNGELWKQLLSLVKQFKIPLVPSSDDTRTGVHIDWDTCRRNGFVKQRGWLYYSRVLKDVNEYAVPRGLHGLKVMVYRQFFEQEQSGWVVRLKGSDTIIERFREAPAQTNGPLLTVRVRKVQQCVVEKRCSMLAHHILLASWLEQNW